VSPVKYELGFYIPGDGILHSHRRENLKSYLFVSFLLFVFYVDEFNESCLDGFSHSFQKVVWIVCLF
jgi:hypothetical protein